MSFLANLVSRPFRFSVLSGKNIDKNLLRLYESLYVKISLGLERFKTKLVPLTSSPVWAETGLLPRHSESESTIALELFARSDMYNAMTSMQ